MLKHENEDATGGGDTSVNALEQEGKLNGHSTGDGLDENKKIDEAKDAEMVEKEPNQTEEVNAEN